MATNPLGWGCCVTLLTVVQLSAVVARPVKSSATYWQLPSRSRVWSAGQVIVGGVVSSSVSSKLQVVWLPAASVAVMVTVSVVPSPVREAPAAGLCVTVILGAAAGAREEQLSAMVDIPA